MAKINTLNYQTVASWNGSQDLFIVEQPDGTKVATPELVKQYVLNNMDEAPTQDSNDTVKSGGVFSTIDDVYSVMGQMGAKNLIPYPYYQTTQTVNGITFTDNGDGSITLNGTATQNSTFYLTPQIWNNEEIKGNVILSSGGAALNSNFKLTVETPLGTNRNFQDTGELSLTITAPIRNIRLFVANGTTVDNVTVKPMLRLASDTDNTYQPYAMTNKRLTDEIATKAENNPSAFSDYTNQGLYAAAQSMTITDLKGGYKVKDGICYVNMQISFTGSFGTPGAWNFVGGFPASAIDGIPIMAVPTNNDTNTVALRSGRINSTGNLFIINESTLTGGNSTAFTFIGSYPVANS